MGERGFTLLDVLVGMGIMLVVTGAAALALTSAFNGAQIAHAQHVRISGIDGTTSALLDDAAGAVAIGQDDSGACSTAPAPQVVFVSGHPGASTVHTVTYAQAGSTVTRTDSATGQTSVIPGVTGLAASCLTGDKLSAQVPELAGITTTDTRMRSLPQSNALGGTTAVSVTLSTPSLDRSVHLTPAIAPSGFTVKGHMQWHAVLWRIDQTHRFAFGFAGKSHWWIYGGVWITYDDWATSQNWCITDPAIYHDSNGDYAPADPNESAVGLFAYCKNKNVPFPSPAGGENTWVLPPNISDCTTIDGTVINGTCPPLPGYTPPAAHASPPAHARRCNPGETAPPVPFLSVRRTRTYYPVPCGTDPPDPNATAQPSTTPAPVPTGGAECYDFLTSVAGSTAVHAAFVGFTNVVSVNAASASLPSAYATYHWVNANGNATNGVYFNGSAFAQVQPPPANAALAVDVDYGSPRYVAGFIPVAIIMTDANGQPAPPPVAYVCVPQA